MKRALELVFCAFVFSCSGLRAEEISVASYLDKTVSVEISEKTLTGAVHAVMGKVGADDPDAFKLNFEFLGTSRFDEGREFKLKLENMKLSKVLSELGSVYKHEVNYDFRRSTVVFTAAGNGTDDERRYRFTGELSEKLGLVWTSEAELEKSLGKYGVGARVVKADLAGRTFTASGLPVSLDHLDMLVYVFSRMPK